ncbi:MAG: hypothetical protein HY966_05955 [Ignavibacteriales bacterium]|nr:hypothetical protein [Ignavibacteriales bacterium]
MKRFFIVCLSLLLAGQAEAQLKAASFKKLQEFLPATAPKDFVASKPTGQTSSQMGMSQSWSEIRFTKNIKKKDDSGNEYSTEDASVSVKINDYIMMSMALSMYQMQGDFENETENGYEKSVKVLGKFSGKEEFSKSDDSKRAKLSFAVGNRFLVEMEAQGNVDAALLHAVAKSMPLDSLEKAAGELK